MDAVRGMSAATGHRLDVVAPVEQVDAIQEGTEEAPQGESDQPTSYSIDVNGSSSDYDNDAAEDVSSDLDSSDGGAIEDSDSDAAPSIVSDLSTRKPRKGIRADINLALAGLKAVGNFAASAHIYDDFEPVVHIHGVGNIRLPLSEGQARKIIEKAHQAPYGKGSETLVDVSVRRTFELNSDQFDIANPGHWTKVVQEQLEVVSQELGVDGKGVQAHLYKMLIYEKGAMFKAHTE